jgi:hypothetical protein
MRVLRILVAGLIALGAMAAVIFAAVLVFLTGLTGYFLQLFRGGPAPVRARPAPGRPGGTMRTDDAIEVETTRVSAGPDRE